MIPVNVNIADYTAVWVKSGLFTDTQHFLSQKMSVFVSADGKKINNLRKK